MQVLDSARARVWLMHVPTCPGTALRGDPWNVLGDTLSPQTEDWFPKTCMTHGDV